jgi:GT2 family glycosyltransferase
MATAEFTPSKPSRPSVLIVTYGSRVPLTIECVEGVLEQSYQPEEVLVLVEGDEGYETLDAHFHENPLVHIHQQVEETGGVARARNEVALLASGDVYLFIDDDAIAHPRWIQQVIKAYDAQTPAVGGFATPLWETAPPWYLPPSFYWLVGSIHEGFDASDTGEVRNTFGCNISVRAEVFEDLGGFDESLGKTYDHNLQGEEAEFGIRLYNEYGGGFRYAPDAKVEHFVEAKRTRFGWLFNRAYWQGVTKAYLPSDGIDTEWSYLWWLLFNQAPRHALKGFTSPKEWGYLFGLLTFTKAVGLGYVVGKVKQLF